MSSDLFRNWKATVWGWYQIHKQWYQRNEFRNSEPGIAKGSNTEALAVRPVSHGLVPAPCTLFAQEAEGNIRPKQFLNYRKVLSLELEVIEFLLWSNKLAFTESFFFEFNKKQLLKTHIGFFFSFHKFILWKQNCGARVRPCPLCMWSQSWWVCLPTSTNHSHSPCP